MSQNYNTPKLTIELVPKTCQWSSVRTMVSTKEWDIIRKISYTNADNKCEICGGNGLSQGYKHRVECHEVWQYNKETKTQKLVKLISLCPKCHQVKHIGRSIVLGKGKQCYNHLAKVNNWTKTQIDEHILNAFKEHEILSKLTWKLDITLLNEEPYNMNINPDEKRIFEKKKFKKSKKPKPKNYKHPSQKIKDVITTLKTVKPKKPLKKRNI